MNRTVARGLHRIAVVGSLLLALLPAGQWTLCFGEQGHLAIETGVADCSKDEVLPSAPASEECSDCDECRDVNLQVDASVWTRASSVNSIAVLPGTTDLLQLPYLLGSLCAAPAASLAWPARNTHTTILRC